jgi:hypothetical protein
LSESIGARRRTHSHTMEAPDEVVGLHRRRRLRKDG